MVHVAVPFEIAAGLPPAHVTLLLPSLNATVPALTVELPVTVAVSVTELFAPDVNDGLMFELSDVVVDVAAEFRVKIRLQPLIDRASLLEN